MKLKINILEVIGIFKEIQGQTEKLFTMIRSDIRDTVGQYLSELMNAEMTHFLGRKLYERICGEINHRT
jgi:putative transposase